jgi:hypothetical protein
MYNQPSTTIKEKKSSTTKRKNLGLEVKAKPSL